MKRSLFLTFLFASATILLVEPAQAAEPSGFYLSVRGAVDMGTVTYQSNSDSLNGWAIESSVGWRFSSILKTGLFGIYENLTLQGPNSNLGPMNMTGGGGLFRFFFVPTIFIEGSGGITQARMTTSATGSDLIANGEFYTIGPGAEFKLNENLSFEISLRIRNVIFPQNEFQDARSVFYSAGLTAYFN